MAEIDDLRRRLAAAERVCYLVGISGARSESDRDKAATQAWMDWSHDYRPLVTPVSDKEIAELATRRDVIRQRTLERLRRESAEEQERQRRLDFLECLYIEQGGTNLEASPSGGDAR